jgi:cyanophycin synthetase
VPTDTATVVELRVLEGPNLYFSRPAVKLTLDAPGWMRGLPPAPEVGAGPALSP